MADIQLKTSERSSVNPSPSVSGSLPNAQLQRAYWLIGIVLTLGIGVTATWMARLPVFSFMGPMILAILLGMGIRSLLPVTAVLQNGFSFSSKTILRLGIILLGLRLNFYQIASAGLPVLFLDGLVIVLTIALMMWLGTRLGLDSVLTSLISVGTAICGAAAIVAVAPVLRAKPEKTALAVAYIAIAGTVFSIFYSVYFHWFQPDPYLYGAMVGATLHEVAHVVAAGTVGGTVSADMSILVKLGRVMLLLPVVLFFYWIAFQKNKGEARHFSNNKLPVPWFIFGFLGASALQTFFPLSDSWTQWGIQLSTVFLAMGMSGLGLGVHFSALKQSGAKLAVFTLLGSIGTLLIGIGAVFVGLG